MTYRMSVTWTAIYETACTYDEAKDIEPGPGYVVDSFEVLRFNDTKVRWQAKFTTILEVELPLSVVSEDDDAVQVAFDRTWDIEPGKDYVDDFEVLNTEMLQ